MLLRMILLLANVVLPGVIILIAIGRHLHRRWVKRHSAEQWRRCKCGYLLVGLEIPRCPECGRMIGFDKTPQELGVSEEMMRAEAERRRATRGSADIL